MTCKYFRMFQTKTFIANSIYSDFLTFLVADVVLAASVSTFVTLTLWDSLIIVVYMISLALTFSCYVMVVVMTQYANIPRKNVIKFCEFWRWHVLTKGNRKVLQSCPNNVGFVLGPYGLATAKLGILICDDMTQNAISLILMF